MQCRRFRKCRPERRIYCNFAYSALASLQDGDVGVGVFPDGEEVLIGGAGFGEGFGL